MEVNQRAYLSSVIRRTPITPDSSPASPAHAAPPTILGGAIPNESPAGFGTPTGLADPQDSLKNQRVRLGNATGVGLFPPPGRSPRKMGLKRALFPLNLPWRLLGATQVCRFAIFGPFADLPAVAPAQDRAGVHAGGPSGVSLKGSSSGLSDGGASCSARNLRRPNTGGSLAGTSQNGQLKRLVPAAHEAAEHAPAPSKPADGGTRHLSSPIGTALP
jgi:hypothetical protein